MGRSSMIALFAIGCYHPTLQLDVPCSAEGECPSGQTCVSDRCVADGTQPESNDDASTALDGSIVDGPRDAPSATVIAFKSEKALFVPAAAPVTAIAIPHPACPTGAIMLGAIAMGQSGAPAQPMITPPPGWTLVRRLDHALDATLAVYVHVAGTTEPTQHAFAFTTSIEGIAWIACYANVDTANPIDDDNGVVFGADAMMYPFPSVSPDVPNTMVVGFVAGHSASVTTWTPPVGATERIDIANTTTRSGTLAELLDPTTGATPMLQETATLTQDFALLEVIALRPQ